MLQQGGLTQLSTDELRKLARLIYKKQLPCPFKRSDLLIRGLNTLADRGDLLIGLEGDAILTLISVVLAERKSWEIILDARVRKALHEHTLEKGNLE